MSTADEIVEKYVDTYGEDAGLVLLKVLADTSAGGDGYKVQMKAMVDADGWEVDTAGKLITLDTTNWGFTMGVADLAENLNEAVETEILKVRMGLLPRLGWGTGKVLLGSAETSRGNDRRRGWRPCAGAGYDRRGYRRCYPRRQYGRGRDLPVGGGQPWPWA